jgi:hypothetical protein
VLDFVNPAGPPDSGLGARDGRQGGMKPATGLERKLERMARKLPAARARRKGAVRLREEEIIESRNALTAIEVANRVLDAEW